jgi:hypothetical protein
MIREKIKELKYMGLEDSVKMIFWLTVLISGLFWDLIVNKILAREV